MLTDSLVSSNMRHTGKPYTKRAAHGKASKTSGTRAVNRHRCARYGKLVGSELTAFNANQVLGKLPDMKSWAFNILMRHRSEKVGYKLSKVEDARLGRWTSVGYAQQVVGRAGTKSALTILFRCTECRPMPKDDFVWFSMRKREPVMSHKSCIRCTCAYCCAPSEHETGTCIVSMQFGQEEESCMVYQAECPPWGSSKSVKGALSMANIVHEEDVSSHIRWEVTAGFLGLRCLTLEELEALWRVWSKQDRPARQALT